MKTSQRIFWIGLGTYVVSFFLVGVTGPGSEPNPGSRGYLWAWWALVTPWEQIGLWTKAPGLLAATAVAGLINPMFTAAVLALLGHCRRVFIALRITVLVMFPFCWVPLLLGFHPREGYALWITGMVLVLCSYRREQSLQPSSLFKSTTAN